jgi:hypothetical protein
LRAGAERSAHTARSLSRQRFSDQNAQPTAFASSQPLGRVKQARADSN